MLAVFCAAFNCLAQTPAAELVERYKDVKGAMKCQTIYTKVIKSLLLQKQMF